MKLRKKFFNKVVSGLLAITLVLGSGFLPSQVVRAADPADSDLLADFTINVGTNAKVSSQNTTVTSTQPARLAVYANLHTGDSKLYWMYGGAKETVFPPLGTGNIWIALDLGEEKTLDQVTFDFPTAVSNVKNRVTNYKVLYTSSDSTWTNTSSSFKYADINQSTMNWKSASEVDATDSNLTTASANSWASTSTTFTPVKGRYVMIYYTLKEGSPGTIGMTNLRIFGTSSGNPVVVSKPTFSSNSSQTYTTGSGSAVSTDVNLDGTTLTGITTSQAVYLVKNTDYTLGAVTNGVQALTFNNSYLDKLQSGSTPLTLYFANNSTLTYTLDIKDSVVNTPPSLSPASGSYTKSSYISPTTTINLNGSSVTGITTANAVYLAVYDDYKLSDITGGSQVASFSRSYLESLSSGNTTLTFYFLDGSNMPYSINVIDGSYADTYLNTIGNGYALITPIYTGMSHTVGRPAVIDANAATAKFPVFNVTKALSGTSISGKLIAPNGSSVYTIPATNVDGQGNATITIPDSTTFVKGTYKVELTLTNNGSTLYDNYYFTAIDNFANYKSITNVDNSNNSNVANVNPDSWEKEAYAAIQMDASGKITYIPDYKGNQIMDYSAVGYKGGGVAIPNVPVLIKVSPLEDNTQDAAQKIQDAIDYVSRYPLNAEGYRGTVYLEEGVFRISKPLYVKTSGIVIRGAGAGTKTEVKGDGTVATPFEEVTPGYAAEAGVTKLIANWKITPITVLLPDHNDPGSSSPYTKEANSTLINFVGQGLVSSSISTTVTDQYVGAGQFSVHVASLEGLSVGDLVSVQKAIDANWARSMYMDKIDGASNWVPNGSLEGGFSGTPIASERTIKSIDAASKTITFAEPLSDNLDLRWGVSKIVKIAEDNRMRNVGVENIQGLSVIDENRKPDINRYGDMYRSFNDENHAEVFVSMVNVRDGWMRNFITYQVDTAFVTGGTSRNITVQDGSVLNPASHMNMGERRYSIYYKDSQFMLSQRIYSRFMRHAFIVDSLTSGPNVFFNNSSEYTSNTSEPHFRWSTAGLYDNVTARIAIQDRWNWGTSHGWAGVNYMLYNCNGMFIVSQPQTSANYIIGHSFDLATNMLGDIADTVTGREGFGIGNSSNLAALGINGGKVPNFEAYEYSVDNKVTKETDSMPDSLYIQQLINSHNAQAAEIIKVDTVPEMIDNSSADMPKLVSLSVNGEAVPGFSPDTFSYTYTQPIDYDYSKTTVVSAVAERGVIVDIAYPEDGSGIVNITLTDAKGVKAFYAVTLETIKKSPIIAASSEQVDATNSNYAVNVLNPADYAGTTSLRWAASGASWIRMYLGETAKQLNGVQIGFLQNATSIRYYNLRIEYSVDGRVWSTVPSGTVTSETYATHTAWSCAADGYISSLQLSAGNLAPENTIQTFTFDTPVEARFIRINGNGNMTGVKANIWNNYWRLRPVLSDGTEYTNPTGVTISGPKTVPPSQSIQLSAQVEPAGVMVNDVIWQSSDTSKATVDPTGLVTGIATGDVTITATTADGAFVSAGNIQQAINTYDITVTPNTESTLKSLTISDTDFSPAFTKDTVSYTASVSKSVESVDITAIASSALSTVMVNGEDVTASTTKAVSLEHGSNLLTIVVIAQDGTTKTYTVTIFRAKKSSTNTTPTSGDTTTPETKPESKPVVEFNKTSGIVEISVSSEAISKLNDGSKVIKIDVPKMDGAKAYETVLPVANIAQPTADGASIQIKTEIGTVVLPSNMLKDLSNDGKVGLTIASADTSKLDSKTKLEIENRPIIELSLKVDGKATEWNNKYAPVTISIPYKPTAEEMKNPEHIVVWYIDGTGKAIAVPSGRYDSATGEVTFTTTHFSQYAIAYVQKTFSDLKDFEWAKNQIEVLASKGIIGGTTPETYDPSANITRADFMVLLTKTLGITAETDGNFADVSKGDYYYETIGVAKKLGLSNGDENNMFNPNAKITRQDMMVLTVRALEYANKLNAKGTASDLDKFSDTSSIADYAKDSVSTMTNEGLVKGDGSSINPLENATRAEIAVLMYRIYNK